MTPIYRQTGNPDPRSVNQSNPHHRLERTPTLRLIWHGLPGGLFLAGLGLIATLALVAVS